jgi:hypothetical protein
MNKVILFVYFFLMLFSDAENLEVEKVSIEYQFDGSVEIYKNSSLIIKISSLEALGSISKFPAISQASIDLAFPKDGRPKEEIQKSIEFIELCKFLRRLNFKISNAFVHTGGLSNKILIIPEDLRIGSKK